MIVYKDYITFIILGKEINIISQDNILWTHNRMLTVAEIDENILYLGEHFPNINAAIMAYEKYFNYKLTPEQINQVMIDNNIKKEKESTMTTKTTTKTVSAKTTSKKATASTKKPVAKKTATKKSATSSTKKSTAKTSTAKKTVTKSSTKKAPAKKAPAKKTPAKKASVKKPTSKASSKKVTARAVQSTTNVDRTGVVTVTTKS